MSNDGKRKRYASVIHLAPRIAERDGSWRCHYCAVETIPYDKMDPYRQTITMQTRGHFEQAEDGEWIHVPGEVEIKDFLPYEILQRETMVDHVIPWAKGGSNHLDNLVIACRRCNEKKGAKSHDEYMKVVKGT